MSVRPNASQKEVYSSNSTYLGFVCCTFGFEVWRISVEYVDLRGRDVDVLDYNNLGVSLLLESAGSDSGVIRSQNIQYAKHVLRVNNSLNNLLWGIILRERQD